MRDDSDDCDDDTSSVANVMQSCTSLWDDMSMHGQACGKSLLVSAMLDSFSSCRILQFCRHIPELLITAVSPSDTHGRTSTEAFSQSY